MRSRCLLDPWVAAVLVLLLASCNGETSEDKARQAAEKAQEAIQPLDAGAMEQDLDKATVTKVQEQLTVLKEYMGPITGKLDLVTLNALEAFQRTQGITADGRFNPETLEALETATRAPSDAASG